MSIGGLIEDLIDRWVRPEIRRVGAYHVPDAAGMVKLDAMENPYEWPEHLRREWAERLSEARFNRYPDPHARHLNAILRRKMGIPDKAGLLLGNGSDEIIQMLAMTVAGPGRTLLTVEPGFVMYRLIAQAVGMDYRPVMLNAEDYSLDLDALLAAIHTHQPALVFLALPNNPTGRMYPEADLLRVIDAAPGLVVIDEAYAPFTDTTFMPRVGEIPNLVVMQTLSKMGLAGLRLGFLAGPSEWIAEIDKTRLPYNINVLTQISTVFALEHKPVLDDQTRRIRTEREALFEALSALPGITPIPSEANLILFRTPAGRGRALFEGLKDKGVLIKNLDGSHPLLTDCLRVTVGKPEENRRFLEALGASLRDST